MSFTKKPLCAAVAYAMAASMTLVAADAAAQQSRERIEVTGTNIKRTDSETPSVSRSSRASRSSAAAAQA
jgi:hypothetical protein